MASTSAAAGARLLQRSCLRSPLRPRLPRPSTRYSIPTHSRPFFWSSPPPLEPLELAISSVPSFDPSLLLPLLAILLASASSDDLPTPPWTITDFSADGKGLGVVASRPIAFGELLIAERPICVWPQGLSAARAKELFERMSRKEQAVFMQLAKTEGVGGGDEVLGRRGTNGFAVQLPSVGGEGLKVVSMVFPRIARLNHSCRPNASQAMNFQTLRMEVFAIASIPTGAELNIEYVPELITKTRAERQEALRSSFGFSSCLCTACTAPADEVARSDARRLEIKAVSEGLRGGRGDRAATLEKLERIRVLLEEESYLGLPEFEDSSISNAYAVYASLYARSQKTEAAA